MRFSRLTAKLSCRAAYARHTSTKDKPRKRNQPRFRAISAVSSSGSYAALCPEALVPSFHPRDLPLRPAHRQTEFCDFHIIVTVIFS